MVQPGYEVKTTTLKVIMESPSSFAKLPAKAMSPSLCFSVPKKLSNKN